MRGIDKDGHAANFVETEQIIFYDDSCASFVQVKRTIDIIPCIILLLYSILRLVVLFHFTGLRDPH